LDTASADVRQSVFQRGIKTHKVLYLVPICYDAHMNYVEWVRHNRKEIAQKIIADSGAQKGQSPPVALFTAGIPGAGKTEFLNNFLKDAPQPVLRIDLDALVEYFEDYKPENYYQFRDAANLILEKTLDMAIDGKYHFALDGTFAHEKGIHNVKRSLSHGYKVVVFYIVQDPLVAWNLTKDRELTTKRGIEKRGFVNACENIPKNIRKLLKEHGSEIDIFAIAKDDLNKYHFTMDRKQIETLAHPMYNKDELERSIN
jgi:UDP-N-acetylglucosamine kinase